MALFPNGPGRLQIGRAVEEGWAAFIRAPWPFVLFTLLTGALSLLFQSLASLDSLPEASQPPLPVQAVGALVGTVGSVVVSLWATVGLVRGAWTALAGGRPDFATFTRWDSAAAGRLLLRQLTLALVLLVLLGVAALVAFGAGQLASALAVVPAVVAFLVLIYLLVNQTFLPQLALLEGDGPFDTLQHGRRLVDPQWWQVLLLLLVQAAIVLIGALLCGVGLLAAAPLSLCVATAAYRQLFGTEDRTGLVG
ncbi:hypothetical protein KBY96_08830 [Cyanobium sp. ATX 6A2]|uniref:hypothetical protein n=1 Tax=Cyanobium sp. ATX 6A2 TaxID=2823700 RepID=UPI0020CDC156|nr:hypothetical protein [Cyanobium sp. ATX 6A2]MCP9888029.1 hypothetical protein [Cyanobium sp. ATX 6A2]